MHLPHRPSSPESVMATASLRPGQDAPGSSVVRFCFHCDCFVSKRELSYAFPFFPGAAGPVQELRLSLAARARDPSKGPMPLGRRGRAQVGFSEPGRHGFFEGPRPEDAEDRSLTGTRDLVPPV